MPELKQQQEAMPSKVDLGATKPPGILPRNMQAMIIAFVAVIMVGAIAFSGTSSPRPSARVPLPASPTVVDPNQTRIAEYRQRLEEQSRKLAAEQAQYQQARQQFNSGPSSPNAAATGAPAPYQSHTASEEGLNREQESIEADRKKRAYLSLFASNVALSYRGTSATSPSSAAPMTRPAAGSANSAPATPILTPNGYFIPLPTDHNQPTSTPERQASAPAGQASQGSQDSGAELERKPRPSASALALAAGKQFRIFEGTSIETVLTNRLNGSFVGPINCMVTTSVYSHDGQQLLVPQGSRVLGEVKRVTAFGQERLSVVFHRLIMPDGFSVSLDQFRGLNQIGETGLRDQVNHHYWQIFGSSLAVGAIAGLAQADTQSGIEQSSSDAYRQGVADNLSQTSLRILDRYLNVLPSLTIREGHRVKVYLSDDLLVPAYQNHQLPGDL